MWVLLFFVFVFVFHFTFFPYNLLCIMRQFLLITAYLSFISFHFRIIVEVAAAEYGSFVRQGHSFLEILCYQIIVCTHLRSQDCLFVIKGIQIIFHHAIWIHQEDEFLNLNYVTDDIENERNKIIECIGYLVKMGIHLPRCLFLLKVLCSKNKNILTSATSTTLNLPKNITPFHGFKGTLYTDFNSIIDE